MQTAITTRLAMLLACRGEPRVTPTFLAIANGQIKGARNAGNDCANHYQTVIKGWKLALL